MSTDHGRDMLSDTGSLTVRAGTADTLPFESSLIHDGADFFRASGPFGFVRSSLVILAISSSTAVIPPVAGGGWVAAVVLVVTIVVVVGLAVVVLLGTVVDDTTDALGWVTETEVGDDATGGFVTGIVDPGLTLVAVMAGDEAPPPGPAATGSFTTVVDVFFAPATTVVLADGEVAEVP